MPKDTVEKVDPRLERLQSDAQLEATRLDLEAGQKRLQAELARLGRLQLLIPDVREQHVWRDGRDAGGDLDFKASAALGRVGKPEAPKVLIFGFSADAGIGLWSSDSKQGLEGNVRKVTAAGPRRTSGMQVESLLPGITYAQHRGHSIGFRAGAGLSLAAGILGPVTMVEFGTELRLNISTASADSEVRALYHLGSGEMAGPGGSITWQS